MISEQAKQYFNGGTRYDSNLIAANTASTSKLYPVSYIN